VKRLVTASSDGTGRSAGLQAKAPVPPADNAEAFATVAISSALLIEDRAGQPGAHHRLGILTTIGRTPDNQVVVPVREVSRRHAEIVLTESGYVLKDLGSPNGTFVNGERITEHRLQDEDRIAMGGQVFVFKVR
jgi:pSer/pThr/pTyr-binding forkhead associated (FHA) protein